MTTSIVISFHLSNCSLHILARKSKIDQFLMCILKIYIDELSESSINHRYVVWFYSEIDFVHIFHINQTCWWYRWMNINHRNYGKFIPKIVYHVEIYLIIMTIWKMNEIQNIIDQVLLTHDWKAQVRNRISSMEMYYLDTKVLSPIGTMSEQHENITWLNEYQQSIIETIERKFIQEIK